MGEFIFNIGAKVYCRDGQCGKLAKVVVDPKSKRITDLIVEKGFLLKEDRVIPVSVVESTTDEAIQLAIESRELPRFPKYREVEFEEPTPDWKMREPYQLEDVVHWAAVYGDVPVLESLAPKMRVRVHEGISGGAAVIQRDTPIFTVEGMVARVHHVITDPESGEIRYIIARRGILPYRVVIPAELIEGVDEEGISLDATLDDLKKLQRWTPRSPVDILAELTQKLRESEHDFSRVTATVEKGVVRLAGTVADEEAKEAAEAIARSVSGVIDVENVLDTDTAIVAAVTAALAQDPRTKDAVIEVISDRGVVTLKGQVESGEVRRVAEVIAAQQPGVVAVINELEVLPQEELPNIPVPPPQSF